MLKNFYKTLLVSLLSSSLLTMNISAFAQTKMERGADGVLTKIEKENFDVGSSLSANALQVITMLAVGAVGTKLMMYKKKTTDMTVAAIGSAAYIAAEITNIASLDKRIKELQNEMSIEVVKRSDGKIDQAQIESLEKLKASYEKAKDSEEIKIKLQQAAAAAFLAAAGIATFRVVQEGVKFAKCEAAIASSLVSLGACSANLALPTEAAACGACMLQINALNAQLLTYKAKRDLPGPSSVKFSSISLELLSISTQVGLPCPGILAASIKAATIMGPLTDSILEDTRNLGLGNEVIAAKTNPLSSHLEKVIYANNENIQIQKIIALNSIAVKNLIQKMLDSVFQKAEADVTAMLALGASVTTVFLSAEKALGKSIDTFMGTPALRIAAYGVMAAATELGVLATESEIKQAESNIQKIDKILLELNTLKVGIKANNLQEQKIQLGPKTGNQNNSIPFNSNPNAKTDCILSSTTGRCASLSNTIRSMPDFSSLPDSFKNIASQTANLGDGLNGKKALSGATLASAGDLGSKIGAIKKLNNSLQDKVNDLLSKEGKPNTDFLKNEKNLWNDLKSQTAKILKSSNMSPGAFLANSGLSSISEAKAAVEKIPRPNSKSGFDIGSASGSANGVEKEKGLEFNLKEQNAESNDGSSRAAAAKKNDDLDIGKIDIHKESSDSIFQVISNRYIKSGYPKLLDEIPHKDN